MSLAVISSFIINIQNKVKCYTFEVLFTCILPCNVTSIGKNNNFTRLKLAKDSGVTIEAVGFFQADELKQAYSDNKRISCTYYPEINEFRGNRKLQICITGYKIN